MPEFILDHGTAESAATFRALDAFTQGYIEALFFTDTEHGSVRDPAANRQYRAWDPETDSSLPGDVTFADLSEEALEACRAACISFQRDNRADLDEAIDNGRINDYDDAAAGRDFWYSRNGHGVGYFDRDLGDVGDKLQEAANACGEVNSYMGDDGLIYLS